MKAIQRALDELYLAAEDPQDGQNHVENALEILQDSLGEIGCQMARDEVAEMIQMLNGGNELENVIFELEVINNEL